MNSVHAGTVAADEPERLCRNWLAAPPIDVSPLAASGFSGSVVLLVRAVDRASFVLKSFHPGTSRDHAAWVHRLARHLRGTGIDQVPDVMPGRGGETIFTGDDGTLWELCRFLPGVAVQRPTALQAAAAGEALARLHLAAATLPDAGRRQGPSPGMQRRVEQARRLESDPWESRRLAGLGSHGIVGPTQAELVAAVSSRFEAAINVFAAAGGPRSVARVARLTVQAGPIQPVLRDIWCDHLLFGGPTAYEITGIIDLHAAGIDVPATDIARLMGSWEVSGECAWHSPVDRHPAAIAAYERLRPLSSADRRLIPFLHSTAVIFGLDNWFRWVLEERRLFSAPQRVLDRIDRLMRELQPAIATIADAPLGQVGVVD